MTRRWRPSLAAVVSVVLLSVIALPFIGLILFKFYASQLVQQTEESLQGQAAVLAAEFAVLYDGRGGTNATRYPLFPTISIADDEILPPRPDGILPSTEPSAQYHEIGRHLSIVSASAQERTLVGYRILDPFGTVIGGTGEIGLSLAHVKEVAAAMQGSPISVARVRLRETPGPAVYALSRGTSVRIFVTVPVIVESGVIGVIYLSRTPNNIFRFFYAERWSLIKAGLFMLIGALLIGFVFWRFITRPIHRLIEQTNADNVTASNHFGTREIETLSQSFHSMAERLQKRHDTVETFTAHVTHELKSPLSSVQGAAELMLDDSVDIDPEQRQRFLENILKDTKRMDDLLGSMRDLARARQPNFEGKTKLADLHPQLVDAFPTLNITTVAPEQSLPISSGGLQIALQHLLENSAKHSAQNVVLRAARDGNAITLDIIDDGDGIATGNRDKVMEPFFTTNRNAGDTGMGLSIVRSMMDTVGGKVLILDIEDGTTIRLHFPA